MSEAERAADALAARLIAAPGPAGADDLAGAPLENARALAWALKRTGAAAWNSDPSMTVRAADIADALLARSADAEIRAVAAWTRGMAELTQGRMETALEQLAQAGRDFTALGRPADMAQTCLSRMIALAMLARHEEAQRCGLEAYRIFSALGDVRSAGKVDLNLGNLAAQQDRYQEAIDHYERARPLLASAGDAESVVMATRGLAEMRGRQHRFAEALALYEQAAAGASAGGHAVLTAAIEGDIGALELWRGRFDVALQRLERSRQQYEALGMPHYLAVAEESLADAYADLNLLPEALGLYERSLATYEAARLHTDQAWARLQYARALMLARRPDSALTALDNAEALFADEDNAVGLALVDLWRAELELDRHRPDAAAAGARHAEPALREARHMGWLLHARCVLADALHAAGDPMAAEQVANAALSEAAALGLPQPQRRARMRLGLLARGRGDLAAARTQFEQVVASIESQRGDLPGEAFRGAFLGDKLQPYLEMVRLNLNSGGPQADEQVLAWVERARARALADQMDEGLVGTSGGTAASEAMQRIRESLNACYRQLAHPLTEDGPDPARLLDEVRRLEAELLEHDRRDAMARSPASGRAAMPPTTVEPAAAAALDLAALREALGTDTALVEYFSIDDGWLAAVVTETGVSVVPLPIAAADALRAVEQLRFQTDTLRHGSARLAHRLPELQRRARHHLKTLHDGLWAPLQPRIGTRRAAVVPHGALHYLPFEALFDGRVHEIERREFVRAASAGVLLRCLARPAGRYESALVLGHGDERLAHVGREVERVAARFPAAVALAGEAATGAALRAEGPRHDVVHIACHAQFRNDSPRFSALHLADGAFTVRDAARLPLRCGLLTLSACETGVSAVMPGDELIGLTHAFQSSGAAHVLASLWTVQDEAASDFMESFYRRLREGLRPAAALRDTQCAALQKHPHPYFWAAFGLHGGW